MGKTYKDDNGRKSRHFVEDFRKKHGLEEADGSVFGIPGDLLGQFDADRTATPQGSMRYGNKREYERKLKDHGRRRERRQMNRELFHDVNNA